MDAKLLPCGHHISLLVKSAESGYQYCDLCECRKQRNDAEEMERTYLDKFKQAERRAEERQTELAAERERRVRAEVDAEWAERELLEVMRIAGSNMDREDDIIRLMKVNTIRLMVEADSEKYEAVLDKIAKIDAAIAAAREGK